MSTITQKRNLQPHHIIGFLLLNEETSGDFLTQEEGPSRNMYKGHMEKARGCRLEGGRVWCGEMEKTVIEQQ